MWTDLTRNQTTRYCECYIHWAYYSIKVSQPSAQSDSIVTERRTHGTFTMELRRSRVTQLHLGKWIHWLSSGCRGNLSRSDSSYLHWLPFSGADLCVPLAMTGCDSVSHLLSYTAAFATNCKLQKAAGCSPPQDSLRQRCHASFAGSRQRQPGSAPALHAGPVLFGG